MPVVIQPGMTNVAFFRQSGIWVGDAQAIADAKLRRRVQNRLVIVDEERITRVEAGLFSHSVPQTLIFFRITKCVGGKQLIKVRIQPGMF